MEIMKNKEDETKPQWFTKLPVPVNVRCLQYGANEQDIQIQIGQARQGTNQINDITSIQHNGVNLSQI